MSDFVQILNCSEALGTCCTDYGLLTILDILRQVLDLIQMVAPILLMGSTPQCKGCQRSYRCCSQR